MSEEATNVPEEATPAPATSPSKPRKTTSGTTKPKPAPVASDGNLDAVQAMLVRHLRKQHGMTPDEARIQMGYGVPARATKEQNDTWYRIMKIEEGR